jgi:hypothetical protein
LSVFRVALRLVVEGFLLRKVELVTSWFYLAVHRSLIKCARHRDGKRLERGRVI